MHFQRFFSLATGLLLCMGLLVSGCKPEEPLIPAGSFDDLEIVTKWVPTPTGSGNVCLEFAEKNNTDQPITFHRNAHCPEKLFQVFFEQDFIGEPGGHLVCPSGDIEVTLDAYEYRGVTIYFRDNPANGLLTPGFYRYELEVSIGIDTVGNGVLDWKDFHFEDEFTAE